MRSATAINGDRPALVIFPGALGDLVCLLPATEALASRYPMARFELMAAAPLASFFAGRSVFAAGHSIDRAEVASLFASGDGAPEATRRLFRRFGRIYSFFATDNEVYRRRLALACEGAASFYRFRPDSAGHVAASYAAQLGLSLQSVGVPASRAAERGEHALTLPARARIVPTLADFAASREVLGTVGLERGRFVVVMPGSGARDKNWPADQFAALARSISCRLPAVLLLGPAERELKHAFEACGCRVLAGLELPVAAAIIAYARAFVGNDSGVSHLAAALGVPGIVIFGPTDPARWAPLGRVTVVTRRASEPLDWTLVAAALDHVMRSCEPSNVPFR